MPDQELTAEEYRRAVQQSKEEYTRAMRKHERYQNFAMFGSVANIALLCLILWRVW